MLFFLLPFYWKSTTLDAADVWFVGLLGTCAVLSTLDIVFDRVLMRWRWIASVFHGITLFGCLNLVIPALFPDTRTLYSLLGGRGDRHGRLLDAARDRARAAEEGVPGDVRPQRGRGR